MILLSRVVAKMGRLVSGCCGGFAASASAEHTSPYASAHSTLQLCGIIFASWKLAGASPEQWEKGIWSRMAYASMASVSADARTRVGTSSGLGVLSSWEGL